MVMRATITTDFSGLDSINAFVQNSEQVLLDVANEVQQHNESTVLRVMGEYPNNARHPFKFATEKSRRYYFWLIKQGSVTTDGSRYIRSGRLGKSWSFEVKTNRQGVALVVATSAKMARYVGGTMAISKPSLARRSQVAGHRNTGWQAWVDRLNPLLDSIQGDFEAKYAQRVNEIGKPSFKRRGYSTPRKRLR